MNCGLPGAVHLGLVAAGRVIAGDGVAASSSFWMRIRVAILFLDARLTWFRRLPRICLLTVLLLVLVSLDVGGLAGSAVSRIERLGFVAIPLGLALALPLLIFWVCLGLLPGSALALPMLFFRVCLGPSPLGEGSVAV